MAETSDLGLVSDDEEAVRSILSVGSISSSLVLVQFMASKLSLNKSDVFSISEGVTMRSGGWNMLSGSGATVSHWSEPRYSDSRELDARI